MTFFRLVLRSASYHWRTNLAVCLGVAAAVSVLAGALVVGDSVRGSLRTLALGRLGNAHQVIASASFFRETLADDVARASGAGAVPIVTASAFVTHESSGRRAADVLVYGVDERFWRFHGLERGDGILVSPALASELAASAGDVLLARLQMPSAVPLESLFSHKDDIARTVRLTMTAVLPREQLGEFSLEPRQSEVRALFAPMTRIQRDLGVRGRANAVLIGQSASPDFDYRRALTLEDLGLRVGAVGESRYVAVEHVSGILNESLHDTATRAAQSVGLSPALPVFTYLANTISKGDRAIPYSLVSGIDAPEIFQSTSGSEPMGETPADAIVLNAWAARELAAAPGDSIRLEYYMWDAAAGLRTASAEFRVTNVVAMEGLAADRRLAPEYPGITGAASLADWDPPFPIDLSRIRPADEDYWDEFRTTPKAFVRYARARELWQTRYGAATSLRFPVNDGRNPAEAADALGRALQGALSPASAGVTFTPVREAALASSTGATDFGEYFTYFSFFIVVSAVLLALLFFRLGVEQRLRQVGILRASGYDIAHVRRLMLAEAGMLALIGSVLGMAGAVAYAYVIVYGLETWWVGAVGTTLLDVYVRPLTLALGAAAGLIAALLCIVWSLRAVARQSPRALLAAHSLDAPSLGDTRRAWRSRRIAVVLTVLGASLLTLGFVSRSSQAGAFFGAGAALLSASLLFLSSWLRARDARAITGDSQWPVARLGFRSAAYRPSRSVLSAALIAAAAFIIVSVDAFRRGEGDHSADPRSGTGGFALLARSDVPIVHNPNDPAGRDALLLNAPEFSSVRVARFRIKPGEDASCLNLYRPGNPTIIAPEASFISSNRFTFTDSLAESEEERANPWLLLRRTSDDGTVPVIADATSLQYVLHASVGDTFTMDIGAERPLTLRFVGALRDSVLQGELVMGEEHFIRLFPGQQGFRFFLLDAPDVRTADEAAALAEVVEKALAPFGVDAIGTAERLAAFHRVENTYLSTFQALGGLGLLLGTVGLATVMFRNVLERRRELALLRAVGYDPRHVSAMIVSETMLLLGVGIAAGVGCAVIAVAPAWLNRGGTGPGAGLVFLLGAVLVVGLLSSLVATRAALKGEVLQGLRAE
jgi:putative ABC transport system permease protein